MKVPADSVSGENLLFAVFSHGRELTRELSGATFFKGTNPIHENSTLMT